LGEQNALAHEHPCCTVAKRVLHHQDELFQFVLAPGLPADNNLAECLTALQQPVVAAPA
jgi:hypothetical protein